MKTKILFVDDEEYILKSVNRCIRPLNFEVFLANSTVKAFEILSNNSIDIIVSDMKMPNISGIDFLKEIKKEYSDIHRLILSGHIDRNDVLQAVMNGVAFEYITKPWNNITLQEQLIHIVNIRNSLTNSSIKALINNISELPKNFDVLKQFEEAVDNEKSLNYISSIIENDLSLTTKILQLVNSAFYTGRGISNVQKAVSMVGLNSIKNLIFTSSFMKEDNIKQWQQKEIDKEVRKAVSVNKLLGLIYKFKLNDKIPDEYSTIGLIYDIGKIILIGYFPYRYQIIIKKMKECKCGFYEAELKLGFKKETHQEIGAYFLNLWNFSRVNIEGALFHHNIGESSESLHKALELLVLSQRLIDNKDLDLIRKLERKEKINFGELINELDEN